MSKNEVWEGEMKAQKKWVIRKAKDEKKIFFSELGSPSFQKILGSEDEEDDDDDVAGRVGDWRNMGNIEPTNTVKFKQLEEYMEGSRRGGNIVYILLRNRNTGNCSCCNSSQED